jgi:hypothetical protein
VFTRYAEKRVTVPHGLNGEMYNDSKLANRAAHLDRTPRGYTWHHVEDGTTMELVPTRLHKAVEHTGGRPAITVPQLGEVTPGSEFTTHERLIGGFGAAGGFATTGG